LLEVERSGFERREVEVRWLAVLLAVVARGSAPARAASRSAGRSN
jgi:hypothetical protein